MRTGIREWRPGRSTPPRPGSAGSVRTRTIAGMSFLRRRSAATPAGPDFDVLAMDPGDWPGNLGAGLLPAPDGSCQGVFLRYDLFGGRGPAMIIGNLPEGSPAREVEEGEIPFEVGQLLVALENDEPVHVTGVEDTPVMQGDNLLIVRRLKLSESRISCVQFDRSDNVLVTIASWDRPITDDLYALLKPLPAELFQQG
ncbi:hypothetical protein GCM10010271_45990 [Streptomyces kurssanovii]|nr:hypothetical protein GCM10010271_45990 [Streptomyces kurssanovii]